jgi:hypothetical protein
MYAPSEKYFDAVMRILRYLKKTPGKGIQFRKNGHLKILGYTDVNWAGNKNDRRSTSCDFIFVGGKLVMWRSKK